MSALVDRRASPTGVVALAKNKNKKKQKLADPSRGASCSLATNSATSGDAPTPRNLDTTLGMPRMCRERIRAAAAPLLSPRATAHVMVDIRNTAMSMHRMMATTSTVQSDEGTSQPGISNLYKCVALCLQCSRRKKSSSFALAQALRDSVQASKVFLLK